MVLLLLAGGVGHAGAAEPDPQARRKQVQEQRARLASQVDVLKASDAQVERALDDLESNVRAQESKAASTRQAADVAARGAADALQQERRTADELKSLRTAMRRVAVNAYVMGPTETLALALDSESVAEMETKRYLLDVALGRSGDLADQLQATAEDLAQRRKAADEAQKRAVAKRREAEASLAAVKAAQDKQQQIAASVDERVDRALAEAASLAALDSQLAAEISKRQEALTRRVVAAPARPGAVARPVLASRRVDGVSLTTVRGITVASEIAGRLSDLLAAADADGVPLSGSGYRSSSSQVALRQANCGSSDYAVYEMSPSSCRPPTARPGASMHERGLAVDFTYGGRIISSRSSPGFAWLARNASRFGFYNLPSEPWHWSTNGQ